MKITRFAIVAIGVALAAVTGSGCYSTRENALVGVLEKPESGIQTRHGQPIAGFTTADGRYREFDGRVRVIAGDSLEFFRDYHPGGLTERPPSENRLVHARSDVATIFTKELNPAKTILATIGITVLVAGILLGIAIATKESCPFLYSWDGEKYVFDGEPYGGATMAGLERTDWSELEHLVPVGGEYRLAITNEVDETQHTNSLSLLVVDHPAGSTVVMDRQGRPHAFRRLEPLSDARDENGRDLGRWLRDNDRVSWYPDLERYANRDSLADTRNHLTLRFRRPAGRGPLWLVANAGTGLWGSHMIRSMLMARGDRLPEFYAAINGSSAYRQQLLEWNEREELFELFPELRCGDRWVRQDFLPGGGPFMTESRAIPLGACEPAEQSVEIRIHPPVGFWNLNSFHLAAGEDSVHVTQLPPRVVRDQHGADVTARLLRDDDVTLDFPTRDDRATLVFEAPPLRGLKRTVFAVTRGWYEVHMHGLGEPDYAAIDRMTSEPGYVVRRAMKEFVQFRLTGVLVGTEADSATVR